MKTSDNGIKLITSFEGCKLSAYQDPVGVWTIGFGHTSGVQPGMVIDSDTAIVLFKEDLLLSSYFAQSLIIISFITLTFNNLVFIIFIIIDDTWESFEPQNLNAKDIIPAHKE